MGAILKNRDVYRHCFHAIADGTDAAWTGDCRAAAQGFINNLESFEFLFLLNLFGDIFTSTDILYQRLQKQGLNVGWSASSVSKCLEELQALRTDEKFDDLYDVRVDVDPPTTRVRRRNTRYDIYHHYNVVGGDDDMTHRQRFKILYNEVLDATINCIKNRFQDLEHLKFCSVFTHSGVGFPTDSVTSLMNSPYAQFFDKDELTSDLKYLYRSGLERGLDKLSAEIEELGLREHLPQLAKLVNLALSIPLTVCSAERSFSALKRIKTRLRNTMGDKRLSNLAVISIEIEIAEALNIDDIIDRFSGTIS